MKTKYSTPELDVVKFTLRDVILSSPTEGSIPEQGGSMPDIDDPDLPDIPDL